MSEKRHGITVCGFAEAAFFFAAMCRRRAPSSRAAVRTALSAGHRKPAAAQAGVVYSGFIAARHATQTRNAAMNTTAKALIAGLFAAAAFTVAAEVATAVSATAPEAVRIDTVVITAKRPVAQSDVIRLAPVVITATRAQVLAAQAAAARG
jgi:hypothetical protein